MHSSRMRTDRTLTVFTYGGGGWAASRGEGVCLLGLPPGGYGQNPPDQVPIPPDQVPIPAMDRQMPVKTQPFPLYCAIN